jgi:hypothetical protein
MAYPLHFAGLIEIVAFSEANARTAFSASA